MFSVRCAFYMLRNAWEPHRDTRPSGNSRAPQSPDFTFKGSPPSVLQTLIPLPSRNLAIVRDRQPSRSGLTDLDLTYKTSRLELAPSSTRLCLRPALFRELAILHSGVPRDRCSSFLLTAQLLACASILDLKRVVGVLFCLNKRRKYGAIRRAFCKHHGIRSRRSTGRGVSQARRPILCLS